MAPEQRLPISVCIVASNEAHRIRRTLDNVADWAGEIVVVTDNNVTDGTGEIASSYGAKVICKPWQGTAAHRNLATENATQPWILALDADEVVSPALRDEIRRAITAAHARGESTFAAYAFPRCTFYLGRWIRHGDWYPDYIVRLWQREQGHWTGTVHEKLIVQGRVGYLKSEMLHYSMESVEHQIKKTLKYADEFVRICAKQGRTVTVLDLLVRPVWRFWRSYLFRLGFLDGWQGFTIAWMTAFYTFLRYVKVREAQLPKDISP
jgi:glycosyltransferase involved in cell wall biosynthesis